MPAGATSACDRWNWGSPGQLHARLSASWGSQKKPRRRFADCVVDAEAERAASEPKVFTRIHLRYRVAGRGLDPRQVERAVKLSKEKYCSATIMLAKIGKANV